MVLVERILSISMILLSIFGTIYAQGFKKTAGILPTVALIMLFIFSSLILLISLRTKTEPRSKQDKNDENRQLFWVKFLITVLFFISLKYVSYFITAPITILSIGWLSKIKITQVILSTAIVCSAIYGIFILWLNVHLI